MSRNEADIAKMELFEAAENGETDRLKYALGRLKTKWADIFENLLPFAALNGHTETVRFLVEYFGIGTDLADCSITNALIACASNSHIETTRYLAEKCSAASCTKAMIAAASKGHKRLVMYFVLERGVRADSVNVEDGKTCLHLAASAGSAETIKFLVNECRINVDHADDDGNTAFTLAAKGGNLEILNLLYSVGRANPKAASSTGWSALHHAAYRGDLTMVRYLVEVCQLDVNTKVLKGGSALTIAAARTTRGAVEVTNYLVTECGACVNVGDVFKQTPFFLATVNGVLESVKCLSDAGADIEAPNVSGVSPMEAAVRIGRPTLLKSFFSK